MTQNHLWKIFQEECISSLASSDKIKARHFYTARRFIDDLCAINDVEELGRSICDTYPKKLELKVEHQGDYAQVFMLKIMIKFLNLDITIEEGTFIYKLLDKRDSLPFSTVRMPQTESNIPKIFFIQQSRVIV